MVDKLDMKAKLDNVTVEKKNFVVCKQGTIESEYSIGEVVGSGAFATVRKVIHKRTNQKRALKIIKKKKFIKMRKKKVFS